MSKLQSSTPPCKQNTFSSPEPLGLICNQPRDQETTGSGDENDVNMKSDSTVHAQYYIPKPLTDLNAGVKKQAILFLTLRTIFFGGGK